MRDGILFHSQQMATYALVQRIRTAMLEGQVATRSDGQTATSPPPS